jgi:hypothetical protein
MTHGAETSVVMTASQNTPRVTIKPTSTPSQTKIDIFGPDFAALISFRDTHSDPAEKPANGRTSNPIAHAI